MITISLLGHEAIYRHLVRKVSTLHSLLITIGLSTLSILSMYLADQSFNIALPSFAFVVIIVTAILTDHRYAIVAAGMNAISSDYFTYDPKFSVFASQSSYIHVSIFVFNSAILIWCVSLLKKMVIREANLKRDLSAALDQNRDLLAMVAHDIRSPIGGAKLLTDLLLNHESNLFKKELMIIQEQCTRALALSEAIVAAYKLAAAETFEPVEFDLWQLLRQTAEVKRAAAESKDIKIVLDIDHSNGKITADRNKVIQAIDNLVSNAIKFSSRQSEIKIVGKQEGSEIVVKIADGGPGFTTEEQNVAFKPFARISNLPTAGETSIGIGLSITKRLIDSQGGTISLHSQKGFGSTFTIKFPISTK